MSQIPEGICCKKCGSINVVGARGQWGPHTERVNCKDCRCVTWGFGDRKSWNARVIDYLKVSAAAGDAAAIALLDERGIRHAWSPK